MGHGTETSPIVLSDSSEEEEEEEEEEGEEEGEELQIRYELSDENVSTFSLFNYFFFLTAVNNVVVNLFCSEYNDKFLLKVKFFIWLFSTHMYSVGK